VITVPGWTRDGRLTTRVTVLRLPWLSAVTMINATFIVGQLLISDLSCHAHAANLNLRYKGIQIAGRQPSIPTALYMVAA
jgi:hypothetical protein